MSKVTLARGVCRLHLNDSVLLRRARRKTLGIDLQGRESKAHLENSPFDFFDIATSTAIINVTSRTREEQVRSACISSQRSKAKRSSGKSYPDDGKLPLRYYTSYAAFLYRATTARSISCTLSMKCHPRFEIPPFTEY